MVTHNAIKAKEDKNPSENQHPLTISQLSHRCSSLRVAVQFDNTCTNMNSKSAPKVLIEFYGATQVTGSLEFAIAIGDAKDTKNTLQMGNSIKMFCGKDGQMIPEESSSFSEAPKPEQPQHGEGDQVIDTTNKQEEIKIIEPAEGPSGLFMLQDELRGELSSLGHSIKA